MFGNIDLKKDNNPLINNDIQISGSIGMVKMSNDNDKNLFIFFDDHSNIRYCQDKQSIFLYDLFEKVISIDDNYIILLEEPFINDYTNIKFLWNETPHIIKFRNYYKKIIRKCSIDKICYVFPVDIRLIICDVSIDELVSNLDNHSYWDSYKISVIEYFKYVLYLFDYITFEPNLFKSTDNNLIFIKKVFNNFKTDIYYLKLKEQFDKLYNKFIEPNKTDNIYEFIKKHKNYFYSFVSGYPFENSNEDDFLDQYDKLISGLMEFYIFILSTCFNKKNVIIYSGYYHSNNLTHIFEKIYGFKQIYRVGKTTKIEEETIDDINNCLLIEKNIFSL